MRRCDTGRWVGGLLGGRRTEKGWRQREEGREDGDDAQVGGSATSGVLMFAFVWPILVLMLRSQLTPDRRFSLGETPTRQKGKLKSKVHVIRQVKQTAQRLPRAWHFKALPHHYCISLCHYRCCSTFKFLQLDQPGTTLLVVRQCVN